MPDAVDLQELISPGAKAREEDPRDVLFDMVFERLRRDYDIPQSHLDNLIELYCRWSTAIGRKACVDEAKQIVGRAVHEFMVAVPWEERRKKEI